MTWAVPSVGWPAKGTSCLGVKIRTGQPPPTGRSFITKAVYDSMHDSAKIYDGKNMWEARSLTVKGQKMTIYRSSWGWVVD